jgi:pimeloyl-ACP methyl ester carboxylesterase
LLDGLVFVDPIMQRHLGPHQTFARLSTSRRDVWPSREAAASKFRSSKFYQGWDTRVLDKWIEYGLRDLPTEQYPELPKDSDRDNPPVTLSTTAAQEVYLYIRAYYHDDRLLQDENNLQDTDPDDRDDFPFGRPETQELYRRLPEIKPSVLYVYGRNSPASPPEYRRDKMERTGTGVGGSGGAARGKVQEVVLDCGHLVGMEKPTDCAKACVSFMDKELGRWEAEEREWDARLKGLSRKERVGINELWKRNIEADKGSDSNRTDPKL